MNRILIVEDEPSIHTLIKYSLEKLGYICDVKEDGESAINAAKKTDYDIIILDMMLPKQNGIEVCKHVREFNQDVYIIMLTAINLDETKINAFDSGADDYITKPFSINELHARIKRVIKKNSGNSTLQFQNIKINLDTRLVHCDDLVVNLSYNEFELIKYFVCNKNRAISREELLKNIWKYDSKYSTRTVDVHIHKIKEKLNISEQLTSVRGIGYMLKDKKTI